MRISTRHAGTKRSRARRQTIPRGEEPRTFTNILVPIDLSDRNDRPLRIALGLARIQQSRVTLLHVIQGIAGETTRDLRAFYKAIERRSHRTLTQAAKPFVDAALATRTIVVIGDPAREIIRAATTRKVALIVMGSHRVMPGRPGRGLGTISYKVAVACPCPILLAK